MYEYQMVQIPPTLLVRTKAEKGTAAGQYLQDLANEHAARGWEYFRVDTMGVHTPPGCLGAVASQKGEMVEYYVVVFRREKD